MSGAGRNVRHDGLPRIPAALLLRLVTDAERAEVREALVEEHRERVERQGRGAAARWAWGQALASVPALLGRGVWRGWSGFTPRADRWRPGGGVGEEWAKEARYALRRLYRRPGYAVVTVATLAVGVAGCAAVYGIAKRLLIEPLPYRAEGELAVFWMPGDWSAAEFVSLRPDMTAFTGVAAIRPADATLQSGDSPARPVRAVSATSELFDVLGTAPLMGPGFREGDDRAGAEPVAVLSHSLWRDLGSDPAIVGQRVTLSGAPRTVVGVMPEGFWFPDPSVRLWVSASLNPVDQSGNYALFGRLPPGMEIGGMDAALATLTATMRERFEYPPHWDKSRDPVLTPIRDFLIGPVRPAVVAMLGAMALILLIASVNVAALMLGQVDSRGTELAVRSALGAGRRRLVRQLVLEALTIGVLAGIMGAALALLGFRFLRQALPLGPLADAATVDWTLFGAAIAIALLAATAVSLVPALAVGRSDPQGRLSRARTAGIAGRGGRLESALVVAQVALVLLMAAGAALLIRSVGNLRAIDPGMDMRGVALVDLLLPSALEPERRPALIQELVEAAAVVPGVQHAAATTKLPLRGRGDTWGIVIEGRPDLAATSTFVRLVTPGYFDAMGIRLRNGRAFLDTDRIVGEEGVVVINRELAELYFPGEDPIGRRIAYGPRWDRIIGVVDNVPEADLTPEAVPARYYLYEHAPWYSLDYNTVVLRAHPTADEGALLDTGRRAIQAASPGVAVRELTTMRQVFTHAIGPARQLMQLLSVLGVVALTLGTVGVYGVVSHFVGRRRRDWGIQLALGMAPALVVRRIVGRGGTLVAAGVCLGLLAFGLLARLLGSFLYEVGPADPVALLGATSLLLAVGVLAAYLPARRASRIDPALALREQ